MIKNILCYIISVILGVGIGFFFTSYLKQEHFVSNHICLFVFCITVAIFTTLGHIFASSRNDNDEDNSEEEKEEPKEAEVSNSMSNIDSNIWGWLMTEEGSVKSGYPLNKDRFIIGRDVKCDILINDESISRQHAEIMKTQRGYRLTDMNSKNGVYVNNQRINQHFLQDSDRIMIGDKYFDIKILKPIFVLEPEVTSSEAKTGTLRTGNLTERLPSGEGFDFSDDQEERPTGF